jgi:hypothetical protein
MLFTRNLLRRMLRLNTCTRDKLTELLSMSALFYHDLLFERGRGAHCLPGEDLVRTLLQDGVQDMVDDILRLVDEVGHPLALADSGAVIAVDMVLGTAEVIHIVHERKVEVLTGMPEEIVERGEEVGVIVVILVEVHPLPRGEVEREVGALHLKGVEIGA